MKYVEEFRNPELARRLLDQINSTVTRPWVIMEICGGQTHSILRNGLDQLLPSEIELVHGPGCPVCVTPIEFVDRAVKIALEPDVIFTSFGDMLRVPGSNGDLLSAKSRGADVRMVYSPLEAVNLARLYPDRRVVFFAVGFETTTPNTALAAVQAKREGLTNFFLLVSHVLVPPAIEKLLSSPDNRVQAYLLAGHVCTVTGLAEYHRICKERMTPMAVTGFEPVDILRGVLSVVRQLESGEAHVDNQYARVVKDEGNRAAQEVVNRVYRRVDRHWRGIGLIPDSGLELTNEYATLDASRAFGVAGQPASESTVCISGQVLQGLCRPIECPAFGRECTPQSPLGATMVSSEGACAAYYRYHRRLSEKQL
jgi:hydrogenase expression/formation protein HypD